MAYILSADLHGIEALPVKITVTIQTGLPTFSITGLSESSARESRVRIHAAIVNSGFPWPAGCVVVELDNVRAHHGTGFDLPIALAILEAMGGIPPKECEGLLAIGELSLNGEVRPVRGVLPVAELVTGADILTTLLLVAPENGREAKLSAAVVRTVRTLKDAYVWLAKGDRDRAPLEFHQIETTNTHQVLDMSDIRGQAAARRALEVAAAGGHNLLFIGGPGAGKTMLARRMTSILPEMTKDESMAVTRVASVAGLNIGLGLRRERPFRAPHHSTTAPGLVGGGAPVARPGELSLAHHGVLFLDEVNEFQRPALEMLREPLQAGEVLLCRASGTVRFPAEAMVIGAMNTCPCGWRGDQRRRCRCSDADVARHFARVPTHLMDAFDMVVHVPPVDLLGMEDAPKGEPSSAVRQRVTAARDLQNQRLGRWATNARMTSSERETHVQMDKDGSELMLFAERKGRLTDLKSYDRMYRVARTIADLDGAHRVSQSHVAEALTYGIASP